MASVGTNFNGMVVADVIGWDGVSATLQEIAKKAPATFRKALAAECSNLKKSIAATLRNYKVVKYTPVPNLIGATKWLSLSFPKRDKVTKILRGPKNESALSKAGSVRIESMGNNGFSIGHFGTLAPYASRFQDGVPRHTADIGTRHWMYSRLGKPLGVHDMAALNSVVAAVSPPRPYIVPLAQKTKRDFVPGLAKCLEKIVTGEMKRSTSAKPSWRH